MSSDLDEVGARALGVLVTRPDVDDTALLQHLDGDTPAPSALVAARARLAVGDAHWYRCRGEACRGFAGPPGLGTGSPAVETATGCQGLCEHAPVGVMRIGTRYETFARYEGAQETLGGSLRRAAAAGHFWIDRDETVSLRIDPVHDQNVEAVAPLAPFLFLCGHFRGVGGYRGSDGHFFKELLGGLDAGGHVLSLRMAVGFPLRDGRRDAHEALVLIRREASAWVGHAYTDGGKLQEYRYEVEADGSLCFVDRAPGHGDSATRARKRLVPTEEGFTERLEVERDGRFELYSEVPMVRVKH